MNKKEKDELDALGYTVENHYQFYLKKINCPESKMIPMQKTQIRQAFFAGFGQCLLTLRDGVSKIEDEKKVARVLNGMLNEVSNAFLNQN